MPTGPGKYDYLATYVREEAHAGAVVVIVIDGNDGSGFSVQATTRFVEGGVLVKLLRDLADQIEKAAVVEDDHVD
jgi:hypothetical protein